MQSTKIKNSDVKQQKWKFTKTFPVGEWHRQNFHRMQTSIQFETCEQMHISCIQIIKIPSSILDRPRCRLRSDHKQTVLNTGVNRVQITQATFKNA